MLAKFPVLISLCALLMSIGCAKKTSMPTEEREEMVP